MASTRRELHTSTSHGLTEVHSLIGVCVLVNSTFISLSLFLFLLLTSSFLPLLHPDMRLMPGDELRLRYVGTLRAQWEGLGHIAKVPNSILISLFCTKLIPYGGKCSREKTFVNFAVLWLFAKVFSAKFGRGVIWCDTSKQTVKIVFFTNSR